MEEDRMQDIEKNISSPEGGAAATAAVSSSTSRIARNTLMLYFRQVLIMLVSLYTVLATLGAEDYGIYNVVAGVVVMFGGDGERCSAVPKFLLCEERVGEDKICVLGEYYEG